VAASVTAHVPGAIAVHSVAGPGEDQWHRPTGASLQEHPLADDDRAPRRRDRGNDRALDAGRRGRYRRVDLHRMPAIRRDGDCRFPERGAPRIERLDPDRVRAGPHGDGAMPFAGGAAAAQRCRRRAVDGSGNAGNTRVHG